MSKTLGQTEKPLATPFDERRFEEVTTQLTMGHTIKRDSLILYQWILEVEHIKNVMTNRDPLWRATVWGSDEPIDPGTCQQESLVLFQWILEVEHIKDIMTNREACRDSLWRATVWGSDEQIDYGTYHQEGQSCSVPVDFRSGTYQRHYDKQRSLSRLPLTSDGLRKWRANWLWDIPSRGTVLFCTSGF